MAEELTLGGLGGQFAARAELSRSRLQAQRASAAPPAAALAAAEAVEDVDDQSPADARRSLQRARRTAAPQAGGSDLTAQLTKFASRALIEILEVIQFFVEIETVVVSLLLFIKWNFQILGGNLGVAPEICGMFAKGCDKLSDLASAFLKSAVKGATKQATTQVQSSAQRSPKGKSAKEPQAAGAQEDVIAPISWLLAGFVGLIWLNVLASLVISLAIPTILILGPLLIAEELCGSAAGFCNTIREMLPDGLLQFLVNLFT